jgi:hypothetical protein
MKKLSLSLIYFMLFAAAIKGQTLCTIDPSAQATPGISPSPSQLPCIITGEAYNQTIQVQDLTNFSGFITVDSMILDSVIGLPNGISWSKNPNTLTGGQNGCLTFYGTTNDPTGQYPLSWFGRVWATAPFLGGQTYDGNLNRFAGAAFRYSLSVINPGDSCNQPLPSGINNFSADLNSMILVYPNPNAGVFEFRLDAGKRLNGELTIYDMNGKRVFYQPLDAVGIYTTSIDISRFAKGLYSLQLRTGDGFASRRISVE